jgi:hypothetical protein
MKTNSKNPGPSTPVQGGGCRSNSEDRGYC